MEYLNRQNLNVDQWRIVFHTVYREVQEMRKEEPWVNEQFNSPFWQLFNEFYFFQGQEEGQKEGQVLIDAYKAQLKDYINLFGNVEVANAIKNLDLQGGKIKIKTNMEVIESKLKNALLKRNKKIKINI